MKNSDITRAHKHSIRNRSEVLNSVLCGCFYCCRVFHSSEITEWIEEPKSADQTVACPKCKIDSIIGSKSGYPITQEFLAAMKRHWF